MNLAFATRIEKMVVEGKSLEDMVKACSNRVSEKEIKEYIMGLGKLDPEVRRYSAGTKAAIEAVNKVKSGAKRDEKAG